MQPKGCMSSFSGAAVEPAQRALGRLELAAPRGGVLRPAPMRTAILTDIHANIEALTACVAAAEKEGVDRFVCLGDTVGYGADPNATCDIVRTRCQFAVLGNHDAAVAGRMD